MFFQVCEETFANIVGRKLGLHLPKIYVIRQKDQLFTQLKENTIKWCEEREEFGLSAHLTAGFAKGFILAMDVFLFFCFFLFLC